ncbi:MAG TPA: thioredoxin family protein [Ignavibacteria bacterium]|nr:thioredoxin family protein [Ignavibacteria bacterium]
MAVQSSQNNLGTHLIDFSLKAADEKYYSPLDFSDKDILIIIFMCNHCPYVKAVMDRLVSFQKKYTDKNVQLIAINPNDTIAYPEDSFENMKLFAEKHKMNFPYLIDETQETARKYDAVCTPDIYVYGKDKNLRYRGRIDDSWKDESRITSRDLEKAVELLLADKEIDFQQIPSMGCSIKWISN